MRKDTGQDSKVGIGIHAFDSGRGRLKWPPRVGELFWGKVKKKANLWRNPPIYTTVVTIDQMPPLWMRTLESYTTYRELQKNK